MAGQELGKKKLRPKRDLITNIKSLGLPRIPNMLLDAKDWSSGPKGWPPKDQDWASKNVADIARKDEVMKEKIEIITRFNSPIMTAKEYIDFSRSIIQHLKDFHPIFETVYSWGGQATSWTEIEKDFSNFDSTVFQHIYDREINYKNPNSEKEFLPESISWAGFSNAYSNTKKAKDIKYSVSVGAGGEDGLGFINFQLPQLHFEEFYHSETIKSLIQHLFQVVNIGTAYAITENLFDQIVDFEKPYDVQVGWLNFFTNKKILMNLPGDISKELTGDGCFFWLAETIGNCSAETVKTATKIRDILGELGYLD